MGCNCGGGGASYAASFGSAGGSSWAAAAANNAEPSEWVVTYPDGSTATFSSDTEAYRAVARTGGGIRPARGGH